MVVPMTAVWWRACHDDAGVDDDDEEARFLVSSSDCLLRCS